MGLHIGFSSSDLGKERVVYMPCSCKKPTKDINPHPDNYEIVRYKEICENLAIEIRYPNCTNFEGRKVLVFKGVGIKRLLQQKLIDPHFSKNKKYVHPYARFIPTKDGWKSALKLCENI